MAATSQVRRPRDRSSIRTLRVRSTEDTPGNVNHEKPLIGGEIVPPRRNSKPIILPRPTMLAFAPYDEKRSSRSFFILMIYLITLIILMLTLLQWELAALYEPVNFLFKREYWICIICLFLSTISLSIFMLIRAVRYLPIFNWVMLIFIIELMVIAIATMATHWNPVDLLIYFLLTMFMIIICLLIGSFMPCDLTANAAALFLISVLLFIISQLMLMFHVLDTTWNSFYIAFAAIIICIVLLFVMYHAQLIRGGRYAEIRATDGLFAVIVLFFFFCVIFMLFAYGIWPEASHSKGHFGEYELPTAKPVHDNYNNDDDDSNDNSESGIAR